MMLSKTPLMMKIAILPFLKQSNSLLMLRIHMKTIRSVSPVKSF
jgi:hypothetical protein